MSENFGRDWESVPSGDPDLDELVGPIRAIAFSTPDCFFVGTHSDGGTFPEMGIYRYDRVGGSFQPTRLDRNVIPPGSVLFDLLPFDGSVSDIAIDWADPTGRSIYVTFSGYGSFGHVWHHDGMWWRRRDGGNPGQPGSLLDVPHNAIVVDPESPWIVYAAADIGVWRSTDSGQTWSPFSEGLPDAAVVDIKLHPRRLLRAATHERGVFERPVDQTRVEDIELFIRDTALDLGRRTTVDGLDNPHQRYTDVWHWQGPDIKLDFPDLQGNFQFPHGQTLDFAEFVDELRDDGLAVGYSMESGDEHVVYAQIHNRGETPADNVQVTALITPATTGLLFLPSDYEERVQAGQAISSSSWETIGIQTLDRIEARVSQVAKFVIPPDKLPPPTDTQGSFGYSVLMLVHHPQDPYPITPLQQSGSFLYRVLQPVDEICKTRRLAAIKSVTQQRIIIVGAFEEQDLDHTFTFTLSGPFEKREFTRLRFRLKKYPGRFRLFVPKLRLNKSWQKLLKGLKPDDEIDDFVVWAKRYMAFLEKQLERKGRNHVGWTKARMAACEHVAANQLVLEGTGKRELVFDGLELDEQEEYPFFVRLDHPKEMLAKPQRYEIEVLYERRMAEGKYAIAGGQTMEIVVAEGKKG